MKIKPPSLSHCVFAFTLVLLNSFSAQAYENKVDFTAGFFTVTGTNSKNNTSASVSWLGAYRLGYRHSISSHFDVGLGYGVSYSAIYTGDSIFGLDVLTRYYPLTASGTTESKNDDMSLVVAEQLRPFTGLSFVQHNFQGIQTTFVGFGLSLGCEYSLTSKTSALAEFRYSSLNASANSSATEMSFSLGMSFGF